MAIKVKPVAVAVQLLAVPGLGTFDASFGEQVLVLPDEVSRLVAPISFGWRRDSPDLFTNIGVSISSVPGNRDLKSGESGGAKTACSGAAHLHLMSRENREEISWRVLPPNPDTTT